MLLFYLEQPDALSDETVGLLERMAENASFALDNFDRDKATARITRMFAALTATNEAIMRARSEEEMFTRVCEAAVEQGKLLGAAIFLPEPDTTWFRLAAQASAIPKSRRACVSPAIPRSRKDRAWAERHSGQASPVSATTCPTIRARARGCRWWKKQG